MALVPTFIDGFQYYSYVQCNILSKFDFQDARIKVKVIMAIFRKKQQNFAIALVPTFINGF